ncbi:MAG: 2'-5' RNA ligase family protein, partial [Candidatus Lokiarchaeota archaeon]|nr:2'-5' RNA ligase family protein [Candidatus Lokiarchaeota archaeon]
MEYLIQFRLLGDAKQYAKDVIYDVARKFDVNGVTQNRPVPHISLYGTFKTLNEKKIISEIESVGRRYELVRFRIKRFCYFYNNNKNKVIILEIEPYEDLENLRLDICRRLSKYSTSYKPFNTNRNFNFHVTVAKDIDYEFIRIWDYIQMKWEPYIPRHLLIPRYLLRITIIKNSKILYEYDLMQQKLLNREEALNEESWKKTFAILKQKRFDYLNSNKKGSSFFTRTPPVISETKFQDNTRNGASNPISKQLEQKPVGTIIFNKKSITRESEFYQGFIRLKISITNTTDFVINDVTLDFHFDEILLRIDRHEPDYPTKNGKLILRNINNGSSKSVAVYFDPMMCSKGTEIKCQINYSDEKGQIQTVWMDPKMINVVCPI